MLERVFIAMNGPVKAVLMRYQKEESYRENLHFKEYLSVYEQDVSRNMNRRGYSYEISGRNEEHVNENWRKGDPLL